MSREAHFSFVAVEYLQFMVDAGYVVTKNENFPSLCLVEVTDNGLEALFVLLQGVAHKTEADLFVIDKTLAVDGGLDAAQAHSVMWTQALDDKDKIDKAFQELVEFNTKNTGALH